MTFSTGGKTWQVKSREDLVSWFKSFNDKRSTQISYMSIGLSADLEPEIGDLMNVVNESGRRRLRSFKIDYLEAYNGFSLKVVLDLIPPARIKSLKIILQDAYHGYSQPLLASLKLDKFPELQIQSLDNISENEQKLFLRWFGTIGLRSPLQSVLFKVGLETTLSLKRTRTRQLYTASWSHHQCSIISNLVLHVSSQLKEAVGAFPTGHEAVLQRKVFIHLREVSLELFVTDITPLLKTDFPEDMNLHLNCETAVHEKSGQLILCLLQQSACSISINFQAYVGCHKRTLLSLVTEYFRNERSEKPGLTSILSCLLGTPKPLLQPSFDSDPMTRSKDMLKYKKAHEYVTSFLVSLG